MIKVSVIIPIYKAEQYLRDCLNSVINQTLQNIEIICVDDGSPDHSSDIVREFMKQNENIVFIQQENGGVSSARNAALEVARGQYIYFLDSDDYIEVTALQESYSKAEEEQLDILYFNTCPFFESEEIEEKNKSYIEYYKRKGDYPGVHTGQDMFAMMRSNKEFLGTVWIGFYKRAFIEENKLNFYNGIIHEDNLFCFKSIILAQRVGYIDKIFHHRRMRSGSIMTSKKSMKNVEGYLVCYKEMFLFLNKCQIQENVVPYILDYLYYSIYRNSFNIFHSLEESEKDEEHLNGGICTLHFLDRIQKDGRIETDRNYFKTEKENIQNKLRISNENIDKKNREIESLQGKVDTKSKENMCLKNEIDIKIEENKCLKNEIKLQNNENAKLVYEKDVLDKKLQKSLKQCNKLETSWDYKIGKVILLIPRKVKRGIIKIKKKLVSKLHQIFKNEEI